MDVISKVISPSKKREKNKQYIQVVSQTDCEAQASEPVLVKNSKYFLFHVVWMPALLQHQIKFGRQRLACFFLRISVGLTSPVQPFQVLTKPADS